MIIESINKDENWIIEGALRNNLRYLLNIADRVIYLDVSEKKRVRTL